MLRHVLAFFVFPAFLFGITIPTVLAQKPLPKLPGGKKTTYQTEQGIPYPSADGTVHARCQIDLYRPTNKEGFATVVWFHGGGLKSGNKSIPNELKNQGIAVAAANYRLHPKFKSPVYVQDAASAVAWVLKNIAQYGGDPAKVFVSGHSAGGYLTSMIGLDKSYLAEHELDSDSLAGLIPYSGHTITHFTVRAERGIDGKQPVVDSMAPLFHVRDDTPPILLVTGDRELEMLGRYEENAYFWRMLKVAGNERVELFELDGFNHGGMAKAAHPLLLKFVQQTLKSQVAKSQAAAPK